MGYIHNMSQGFERDNVIVVSRGADIYDSFKIPRLCVIPDVMSVTMSHTVPTKATRTSNMVRRPDDLSNSIWVGSNPVSYDFFQTFGIEVLAGRVFSEAFVNDAYRENEQNPSETTGKIIINRTLATTLGWQPEEAVGQMVTLGNENEGLHSHQIIGVTQDTHYISAKNSVPPMIYVLSAKPQDLSLRWTSIRFKQGSKPCQCKTAGRYLVEPG